MAGRPLRRAKLAALAEKKKQPEEFQDHSLAALPVQRAPVSNHKNGDHGGWDDSERGPVQSLPGDGPFEDALIAVLSPGHRTAFEEATPAHPVEGVRDSNGVLSQRERFGELLVLSIDNAFDILKLKLETGDKNFARLLSTKQAVIASVLSTAARIDEATLRKAQTDKLDEILDALKKEEALRTMPAVQVLDRQH